MVAFLAILAKPAIAGLIKFAVGAVTTYFVSKEAIKNFGNTPANDIKQLTGVPPQQIYEDAKKFREDRLEYYKNLEKKDDERIKSLSDKVDKLEEEKNSVAQKYADLEDKNSAEGKAMAA